MASKCRVGDCGKGRAGLVSPKAAVQPLELLLPILQSLQASKQITLRARQCHGHVTFI